MATPLVTGLTVAAAALAARSVVTTIEAWALAGPRARAFYQGGFEPTMTRREAALILGVRESAAKGKVLEAHRRVMMANHPDAGGSAFLSTKINEAVSPSFASDARFPPRRRLPVVPSPRVPAAAFSSASLASVDGDRDRVDRRGGIARGGPSPARRSPSLADETSLRVPRARLFGRSPRRMK